MNLIIIQARMGSSIIAPKNSHENWRFNVVRVDNFEIEKS